MTTFTKRRRFRVSLEKILPDPDMRNPFLAFRTAESFENARCKVLVRTWEFDAVDEDEVRWLFEEAKRDGEPQVIGLKSEMTKNFCDLCGDRLLANFRTAQRDVIHCDVKNDSADVTWSAREILSVSVHLGVL